MDDPIFGPTQSFNGGGKYVIHSAEELRRRRDNGGLSFEFDEARQNVLAALEEIEERDRYLESIKAELEWVLSYVLPSSEFHINTAHLMVYITEIDLRNWTSLPFDPDWCVRPGDTLVDWREENNLTTHMAAAKCRMSWSLYRRVELGQTEIDLVIATCLELGTGSPAGFWLERERHYREDKAKGKKDISKSDIDKDGRYRPGR